MYKLITKILNENGYNHYEISNFSKEGYESNHNKTYWLNNEYYGFGLGASSYIDNKRITNTRSITKYLKKEYISEIEELKKEDIIEYEIILNLRLSKGIDLKRFKIKYKEELINIYDYKDLVNNNLLNITDNHLYIKEDNLYISNEIITRLLQTKINK